MKKYGFLGESCIVYKVKKIIGILIKEVQVDIIIKVIIVIEKVLKMKTRPNVNLTKIAFNKDILLATLKLISGIKTAFNIWTIKNKVLYELMVEKAVWENFSCHNNETLIVYKILVKAVNGLWNL